MAQAENELADDDAADRDRLQSKLWESAQSLYVGIVIFAGAALTVTSCFIDDFDARDFFILLVLCVVGVLYDLIARRIERVRQRTSGPYVTMASVWFFSSALLLPSALTAVLAFTLITHTEIQSRIAGEPRPLYRVFFNIATVMVPASAVFALATAVGLTDLTIFKAGVTLVVVATVVTYAVINSALIGGVLCLAQRRFRWAALGSPAENLLELATLTLGALVAFALSVEVWLVVLALPVLALVQRIALVEHLESAASEDSKTGLLNAAAWDLVATRELGKSATRAMPATVMLIDLDHFKIINDKYGHLTGDAVLRSVADCMTGVLRDQDLLSRFGGEEFIALLPGADCREAARVAERLRQRIADGVVARVGGPHAALAHDGETAVTPTGPVDERIPVTVSVGLASFPDHGTTLTDLVARADSALYEAKRAGRNRVHASA